MTDLVTVAHRAQQEVRDTLQRMRRDWVRLAGLLHDFHEREHWRTLGFDSFEQWLAGPDIDLSRSQVFALLQAHRVFVLEHGVHPSDLGSIGQGKMREVLPAVVQGRVPVTTAISDAQALGRDDLRRRYTERSTGPIDRPLDAEREPERDRCPACGRLL